MRLAFIVSRYGTDLLGGAETHCREYVERLHAAGHDVQVLTTCVRNHFTWANDLPAGATTINGVAVRRFPVTRRRDERVMAHIEAKLRAGAFPTYAEQRAWIDNTGYSEALLQGIADVADRVDAVLFMQYIFSSTCDGVAVRPERSVVIPCLHDEPYARFQPLRQTLRAAAGLIFNTDAERDLCERLIETARPSAVVGIGFDPPSAIDPAAFRRRHDLGGEGIVYAGRREAGKNWPLLVEWLTMHSRGVGRTPPMRLFAMGGGPAELPVAAREFVVDLGLVPDAEKFSALATGVAVCQLSVNESFSYVIMEGWLAGVPCVVHAGCAVTRQHCERSGGGVWVNSAEEFSETLDRFQRDAELRHALARQGRAYVAERYSWSAVIDRLTTAVESILG